MIFVIVAAILAYRTAKQHDRSGPAWAAVAALVFLGTQVVVSLSAGFFLGLGVEFFGWSESLFDDSTFFGPVAVVALGASILATWLLLRYLNKPINPDTADFPTPPPPPTFGGPQ